MKQLINSLNSIFFILFFWITVIVQIVICPILLLLRLFQLFNPPSKTVVFIENFPINNSGYYYRSAAWSDLLNKQGYKSKVVTLIKDKKKWDNLVNNHFKVFLIQSMWKRFFQLFITLNYKTVIVRRELLYFNEYGDLYLDRILNVIHSNVILDIDDDLGAAKNEPRQITSTFGKLLIERGLKFQNSIELYKKFIVGSEYLSDLVRLINPDAEISIIPTCVKAIDNKHNFSDSKRVFGWIGSTGNLQTLKPLIPLFNVLQKEYSFKLITISGEPLNHDTEINFELEHIQWNREKDIQNLDKIDIGLMPLHDNTFTRGKCGFKLIQYMSMGIPSIGQKITVNNQIINNENQGWLVSNIGDWNEALIEALNCSIDKLQEMGINSQEQINSSYTFEANQEKLIEYILS